MMYIYNDAQLSIISHYFRQTLMTFMTHLNFMTNIVMNFHTIQTMITFDLSVILYIRTFPVYIYSNKVYTHYILIVVTYLWDVTNKFLAKGSPNKFKRAVCGLPDISKQDQPGITINITYIYMYYYV